MEMEQNFSSLLENPVFEIIRKIADKQGVDVYVVGGWVRDLIMNRPNVDIDFTVNGSGIELAKEVAKSIKGAQFTFFKNFGTAMISCNIDGQKLQLEFVGMRKESYRSDSRKPIVEDGTIEDDQNRRDFTINAMAISLNNKSFGELLDPFDGVRDIENKVIRTPLDPDVTFSDDPLRMIRAIRFSTQLNFSIEYETLNSITRQSHRLPIISQERITEELNKIMLCPTPGKGLFLLEKTGLMQYFLPELVALKGVEIIDNKGHKDNFYHTLQVLDNIAKMTDNLWLRYAALFHDIAKAPTKKYVEGQGWTFHGHEYLGAKMIPGLFKKLRLPLHDPMKYVQKLVQLHLRPIALVEDMVTDSAVRRLLFDAGDDIDDLMTLCHADITSKNEQKVQQFHRNFELVKQKMIEIEEHDRVRNWQPPITGELIMKTFGLEPSREVGVIKNAIREAILDGDLQNDFEDAYKFMLEKGYELGLKPAAE
ncbi:MAG: HD domain-containing protein [Bacteroidales bacterium]|nr:HD domain-containing protein [Bacteroidales bacterium]